MLAQGPGDLGAIMADRVITIVWETRDASGAAVNPSVAGTIKVLSGDETVHATAGITDNRNAAGLTGVHNAVIAPFTRPDLYYGGQDYYVVLEAATIDGQTVNAVLARFTINDTAECRQLERAQAQQYGGTHLIYVDGTANTLSQDGSLGRPFGSLEAAADYLASLPSAIGYVVLLSPGQFFTVDRTLVFPGGVRIVGDPINPARIGFVPTSLSSYSSGGDLADDYPHLHVDGGIWLENLVFGHSNDAGTPPATIDVVLEGAATENVLLRRVTVWGATDAPGLRVRSNHSATVTLHDVHITATGAVDIDASVTTGTVDIEAYESDLIGVGTGATVSAVRVGVTCGFKADRCFLAASNLGVSGDAATIWRGDEGYGNIISLRSSTVWAVAPDNAYAVGGQPGAVMMEACLVEPNVTQPGTEINPTIYPATVLSYPDTKSPGEQVLSNPANKLLTTAGGGAVVGAIGSSALTSIATRLLVLPNSLIANDTYGRVAAWLPPSSIAADSFTVDAIGAIGSAVLLDSTHRIAVDAAGGVTVGDASAAGKLAIGAGVLIDPANKLESDAAGGVTVGAASAAGKLAIGDAVLVTAAQKIVTDGSGRVTAASVAGSVGSVVAGVNLAATGLDGIPLTAPDGPAADFREMLVQLWRRFFKKTTLEKTGANSGTLQTFADDGTTVVTTQTFLKTVDEEIIGGAS